VWDAASGQEVLTLTGHTGRVVSVAWSPDGKRLATGSEDQTAKVWDAVSGQGVLTLKGHIEAVTSVAWSPDGKRLATGSLDQTAKVWDAASGHELLTLKGHTSRVVSVAWSPDGKRLATGSWDFTAKEWDAASGHELLTLKGHNDRANGVAWSPDGKRLATGSYDKTVQIYAMDPPGLLDLARGRVTRNFTPEECKRYFQSENCPPLPAQKSSVVVQNGYVELNPIPWAEVLAVKKASGEVLQVPKVPGQTPLRFSLPPGDYVIQVKDSNERVTPIIVKVDPGRPAVWHDTLPGFDPDKAVNELLK
jgi:WD40 repeat protein